jgi:hypothetical protein
MQVILCLIRRAAFSYTPCISQNILRWNPMARDIASPRGTDSEWELEAKMTITNNLQIRVITSSPGGAR